MKKLICVLLIVVSIFALSACSVTIPVSTTSNNVGSKVGVAAFSIIDSLSPDFGKIDLGINTAAKNGGIRKISHVDFQISVLDNFPNNNSGSDFRLLKFGTIVYGE